MMKMRDKYLHTNCLAALANMSGQFRSLHPYVAQRLVSLFETLAKKHARLEQQLKHPNELDAAASTAHQTAVTVLPSPVDESIDMTGGDGSHSDDMVGSFDIWVCSLFNLVFSRCRIWVFWRRCCAWCWRSSTRAYPTSWSTVRILYTPCYTNDTSSRLSAANMRSKTLFKTLTWYAHNLN